MNSLETFILRQDFKAVWSNIFMLSIRRNLALKCPYCDVEYPEGTLYCSICKHPLPTAGVDLEEQKHKHPKRSKLQRWLIGLGITMCVLAICLGIYKLPTWIETYNLRRLYDRGAYKPTVNLISMSDGRQGHALIFYGEDGDVIYLPEMDRSLSICGGVARLEIADADWFYEEAGNYDYADINFAPVLVKPNGVQVQLPGVNYQVDVPESPLTVSSPAQDGVHVVTSSYPLELKVVPGSSVYVNGTDVTERVDRAGDFAAAVSVKPIGDNTYTIIVRTPRHKEVRRDITIFRQQYDIEIELDSEVSTRSNEDTITIKGKTEPGAVISVDTAYMEESLVQDMTTGTFSFIAKLETFGDNILRFRATMDGREDAVVSFTVYYKPTLARYAAGAWAMDYAQLRLLYENWTGKVFLCKGPLVDVFTDANDGIQYMVMNVNPNGDPQYVVLQNDTSLASPTLGPSYSAYADVIGRYFYQDNYYPMLIARYIDLTSAR